MSEKTYINGLFIKKKTFNDGGDIINVDIITESFIEEIRKHTNEKGYCRLTFKNRKEADKNGNNMYCELNTFKPAEKGDGLPF